LPEMNARDDARVRQQLQSSATAGSSSTPSRVWVVLPTYDEVDNLPGISAAILEHLPNARILVVDDNSPDGTGHLADELASEDDRILVLHRTEKNGLGRAYLEGFRVALAEGADVVVQMDADFSHDPAALPRLLAPILSGDADLVIGSRYVAGGIVLGWPRIRRLVSRAGSLFARIVLAIPVRDLTGGFKAWRAATLGAIPSTGVRAGGYVFQIEMTHRAYRGSARIAEVPITFRDRTAGVSKMNSRIVVEALWVVVTLGLEATLTRRHGAYSRLASIEESGLAK